jgi:hypothetical protein
MMAARYRFVPWARLGAAPTTVDTLGAGVPAHTTRSMRLRVGSGQDVPVTARIHGPGDIVGLDARQVVRTDPPHLASEFEPNYFPLVEFDRPDLPWLFTPATGDAQGRLRPWLVLVVVRLQPGVSVELNGTRTVLRIAPPARPGVELPDLAESWAWAHAQVVDPGTGTGLDALLAADSNQNLSRLVCPRRLAPNTSYVACLVPAFEIGRRSGLGLPITEGDAGELTPAWPSGAAALLEVDLPVLHRFDFSTGDAGDFESLVTRLQPRPAPDGTGTRPLAVSGLGFGLPELGDVLLGGALRPIAVAPRGPLPPTFTAALGGVLDLPAARQTGGSTDPVVGPPIYGERQAAQPTIAGAPPWIATLNVDPRLRAAAGLGSLVVQDQQEHLMAAAWEQLGSAANATRELRQPVFAGAVLGRVRARLATLDPDALMAVAAPMLARVPATTGAAAPGTVTLQQQLVASRTPTTLMSAAFRRAVRPQGALVRRVAAAAAPEPTTPSGPPTVARMRFVTQVAARPSIVFHHTTGTDAMAPSTLTASFDQNVIISLPEAIQRNISMRAAVDEVQAYYQQMVGIAAPPDDRPPILATAVFGMVMAQVDPARTITPTVTPLVAAPGPAAPTPAAAPPDVVPELPGPSFPQPMYEPLRDLDPQYLLPGCDLVLPDSVVPLASDAGFIEAFLAGLNHEMSRELLWREYPSDERSTSFRVFWTPAGADPRSYEQLPPIHEWLPDSDLGSHFMAGTDGNLVVLVRGELFHRYPSTIVYLTRSTSPGDPGSERILPLFRGDLATDMTFLGFGVAATDLAAETWYVVFEQQPTEPRFGLDTATTTGRDVAAITSWNDLAWGDLAATDAELAALSHVSVGGRLAGHQAGPITWGTNSGHMAAATLQRSFRIAIPLTDLVPTS